MKEILRQLEELAKYASSKYRWLADNAMKVARETYRDMGPESAPYKAAVEEYNLIIGRWYQTLENIGRVYAALTSGEIMERGPSEEDMRKLYNLLDKLSEDEAGETEGDKTASPA